MDPQEYMKKIAIHKTQKKDSNFFLKYLKYVGKDFIDLYNKSFQIQRCKVLVRLHLSECIKYNKIPFIDHRTLSSEIGCSTKTVQRAIREMEQDKELVTIKEGNIFEGISSIYKLTQKGLQWLKDNAFRFIQHFNKIIQTPISKTQSIIKKLLAKGRGNWTTEENELFIRCIRGET